MQKSAFTLIEVMLGIMMLSIVFLALSSLFVGSLRANKANLNSLRAYNLAQEGLEMIRNSRDSNWAQNLGWIGTEGFSEPGFEQPMDTSDALKEVGDYVYLGASVDFSNESGIRIDRLGQSPLAVESLIMQSNKVRLCEYDDPSLVGLYLFQNSAGTDDCEDTLPDSVRTPFHRFMRLEVLDKDVEGRVSKVLLTSTVFWLEPWNDLTDPSRVDISTELTDWKGGPL